ncbi:MAG: oligosaccharide flippase family protein [Pseudotabrizicola sp.]|uniref:oligosaccharide flippase family protein n=1 Tax=Pseudotabrizicola sp. TaxID=2939647 RepID=UPI002726BA71|nr:oligosaccharide flippase family protein [Pseudotabrizicola sp.]MDO9640849.1 oligosaccharide flippase family protein [Pseudotabrizicola sp.]
MLRTALLILSGNAAASLLLLARNLIVARMIPVADYGIAATFALAMAVVEMASAFGLQQQIVQSKDGDDPRFQAALQGFQLLRGVASGVVLFLLAGPLARFMGIPEVIWAYQVLAVVPVLNALVHFDIHRMNRQMQFGPLLMTGAMPAVVALALVWPLSVWFGDWRVMLWSILAQSGISVLTSHLMAERPYRLAWDKTIVAGSLRFGWPLLVNAVLMFAVFQGDKLIVGRVMGMEALAIFAMGVTLTLTPTLVLAKSAQNIFLPKLSQLAENPAFSMTAQQTMQTVSLAALLFTLATLLIGGPVVTLLLGTKYATLLPLLIWFAVTQALRVMKAGPAIVALALGHTTNPMVANIVRVITLPLAWLLALQGGGLQDILMVALVGEGLGLIVSILLLVRHLPLPRTKVLGQQTIIVALILAAGAWSWYQPPGADIASWPEWLFCSLALLFALAIMPETARGICRMRIR